jgi:hypothetical protein
MPMDGTYFVAFLYSMIVWQLHDNYKISSSPEKILTLTPQTTGYLC